MYTHIPSLLNFPLTPMPHLGHHRARSWAPCTAQQAPTSCLTHGDAHRPIPASQFTTSPQLTLVHTSVFCVYISFPALWVGSSVSFVNRGWDGWMASRTLWRWVWVNSRSWWRTGSPGELRFMGLQRVGHDWAAELNWTDVLKCEIVFSSWLTSLCITDSRSIHISTNDPLWSLLFLSNSPSLLWSQHYLIYNITTPTF